MKSKTSAAVLLSTLAALGGLGAIEALGSNGTVRVSTIPTEDELEWMNLLQPFRRKEWQARFKRGLTPDQRAYVNEEVARYVQDPS